MRIIDITFNFGVTQGHEFIFWFNINFFCNRLNHLRIYGFKHMLFRVNCILPFDTWRSTPIALFSFILLFVFVFYLVETIDIIYSIRLLSRIPILINWSDIIMAITKNYILYRSSSILRSTRWYTIRISEYPSVWAAVKVVKSLQWIEGGWPLPPPSNPLMKLWLFFN